MAAMQNQRPEDVKVACFGLGAMGSAILRRLTRQGFEVRGYDVDWQAVERVRGSKLPADLVEDCDVGSVDIALSCVPADEEVVALLTGDKGIMANLSAGSSVVEMSTVLPETVRKVAAAAADREVGLIDIGVTGGPEALEADDSGLTLYVGGLAKAGAPVRLLLSAVGEPVDCGEVGNGKLVKLVNNLMSWGNVAVAAEAFNIGTAAGVDERQLYEALTRGGGRSNQFVKRFERLVNGDDTTYFSVELGTKDVRLARQVAEETSSATPLASVLEQLYERAEEVMPNEDVVSIYEYYRETLRSNSLEDKGENQK